MRITHRHDLFTAWLGMSQATKAWKGPLFDRIRICATRGMLGSRSEAAGFTVFGSANASSKTAWVLGGANERGTASSAAPLETSVLASDQWACAPEAPMPVSERTNCASKAARSRLARRVRSIDETAQIVTKASGIENRAGLA